jgi:hypothetical protein
MVGRAEVGPLTMRLNGGLQILPDAPAETASVTAVTRRARARSYRSLSVRRETWERLNVARLRAGQTWDEFLGMLEDDDGEN